MIVRAVIPTVEAAAPPHTGAAVLLWVLPAAAAVSRAAVLPAAVAAEAVCPEVVEDNKSSDYEEIDIRNRYCSRIGDSPFCAVDV